MYNLVTPRFTEILHPAEFGSPSLAKPKIKNNFLSEFIIEMRSSNQVVV